MQKTMTFIGKDLAQLKRLAPTFSFAQTILSAIKVQEEKGDNLHLLDDGSTELPINLSLIDLNSVLQAVLSAPDCSGITRHTAQMFLYDEWLVDPDTLIIPTTHFSDDPDTP
jgi:hypothetical protein